MGKLALLGLAALCTGLGWAEVVSNFSSCSSHFYGQEAPRGFGTLHTASICQRYKNRYQFATFYDKRSRTPLWSAYTLDPTECQEKIVKIVKTWKVEPKLSGLQGTDMMNERDIKDPKLTKREIKEKLKQSQAINKDYEKTGYDRGHLNPNSFQCDDGRNATYTLTNAAPMNPRFNRVQWCLVEQNIKAQLIQNCPEPKQNAFLVTGVVPNDHHKIPQDAGRVAVLSHVWTAVCCHQSDNNQKFAFAFLAENKNSTLPEHVTVTQLNQKLQRLYGKQGIQIFQDDCNEGSPKAHQVLEAITSKFSSSLPNSEQDACHKA